MKKIVFVILLGLIFNCSSKHNYNIESKKPIAELNYIPYYLKIYEADSLYMVGNYTHCYKVLDSIFKKFTPKNSTLYYEYKTYVKSAYLSNNKYNIKEKLTKLISNFGLERKHIKSDSIFNSIFKLSKISENEYSNFRKLYLENINLKLREEILEMTGKDQFYRTEYNGEDLYKKRHEVDSINQQKLKNIFDKGIYPSEQIIGGFSIDNKDTNILFMLLHTRDSVRLKYFLPKIKEFIRKGECVPIVYGYMVDQYHLYNKRSQVYGTYNIYDVKEEEIPLINQARKKMGLPSFEYEIWKRNEIMKSIK